VVVSAAPFFPSLLLTDLPCLFAKELTADWLPVLEKLDDR
jgi:hypothetical protein